jgi:hypothetical protein
LSTQAEPTQPTPIQLQYTLSERTVTMDVAESLFTIDAIYGTAYLFVDRCWLFMTRPSDGVVGVNFKIKEDTDEAGLEALAGEFVNELLN